MNARIPIEGGWLELPPDVTTHEEIAEWESAWKEMVEAGKRQAAETLKRAADVEVIAAVLDRHTLTYRDSHYENEYSFSMVCKVICKECGELGYDTEIDEDEAKHQARELVRHLTGVEDDDEA